MPQCHETGRGERFSRLGKVSLAHYLFGNMSVVNADISSIHFRGASIVRVIEDVDRRSLTFEVSYPLTERDSDFRRGKLIFALCSRYLVAEGHCTCEPVIQRAEVVEVAPWGAMIRIYTDRGVREVSCYSITEEREGEEAHRRSGILLNAMASGAGPVS